MKQLLKKLEDFQRLEVKNPSIVKGGEAKPIIIIDEGIGRL